mmetsp:Transcript_42638/g.123307  ORF Transcript_42638/g.123307 Transcript_42638/m.123307 type:complete len:216 (+) Transcript_42638:107-754(+)
MRVARQDPRKEAMDLLVCFRKFVVVWLLAVGLDGKLTNCIYKSFTVEVAVNAAAVGGVGTSTLCTFEDLHNVQPCQKVGHDLQLLAHQQELVRGQIVAPVLDDWCAIGICVSLLGLGQAPEGGTEALHRALRREKHGVLLRTSVRRAPGTPEPALGRRQGGKHGVGKAPSSVLVPGPLSWSGEAAPRIGLRVHARRGAVALLLVLLLLELTQGKG